MNKIVSLSLLVGGIVLIAVGIIVKDSLGPDVSRYFAGWSANKGVWMLDAGNAAALGGLMMLWRGPKHG
jgi:uncharacterized protein DUF3185